MIKKNLYMIACMALTLLWGSACNNAEEALNELIPTQEEETLQKETEKDPNTENGESTRAYTYKNEVTLEVKTPGTLKTLLGDSLTTADKLILSGSLKADDITTIVREMTALLSLDITNTKFVEDGGSYKNKSGSSYKLKEDVIGQSMFYNCDKLTEIKLPKTIKQIDESAFYDCDELTIVEIPSAEIIGGNAFYDNNLSQITLPENLTSIGANAFCYNEKLTQVTLPESLTSIGKTAFKYCYTLSSINFPGKLESIGEEAFYACALKTVNLPESVKSVGNGAFSNCKSLTSATLPKMDGIIREYLFYSCESLSEIKLTEGITDISQYAFAGTSITSLDFLPESVETLGNNVFAATDITTLKLPKKVNTFGKQLFYNCRSLTEIVWPETLTEITSYMFGSCVSLQSITVPEGVTSIDEYAFSYCDKLSEIKLPSTLTKIGAYAFKETPITSTDFLPESLTSLGEYAFENCDKLTTVKLPNSLTSLNKYTFKDCDALTSVIFPDGITFIGAYVFNNCDALTDVVLPKSLTEISENLFYGNKSLQTVSIPEGVTSVGKYAFYNCTSLKNTKLPSCLKSIGSYAFCGCSSLVLEAKLPEGITSIGEDAFRNATSIKELVFPATLTTLSDYICQGCTSLESIIVSEGTTSIGSYAFDGCTKLSNIQLPSTLTTISSYAFRNTGITNLDFLPEGLKRINSYAFGGCSIGRVLRLPSTVNYLEDYALGGRYATAIYLPGTGNITVGNVIGVSSGKTENCLIYTNGNVNANSGLPNVITNNACTSLILSEGSPFDCPEEFTVGRVTFKKQFNRSDDKNVYATKGKASNWYSISVPFTVTEITTADGRTFAPFNSGVENAHPFWLKKLTANGYENATTIEAGEPYIIAFPCSESYDDEYNVWGDVTFTGKGRITIPVTEEYSVSGEFYSLYRNYDIKSKSSSIYLLNSPRDGYYSSNSSSYSNDDPQGMIGKSNYGWGSYFIRALRNSWAFEPYVSVGGSSRAYFQVIPENESRGAVKLGRVPKIDDM